MIFKYFSSGSKISKSASDDKIENSKAELSNFEQNSNDVFEVYDHGVSFLLGTPILPKRKRLNQLKQVVFE